MKKVAMLTAKIMERSEAGAGERGALRRRKGGDFAF
jgi:hypothetical protein